LAFEHAIGRLTALFMLVVWLASCAPAPEAPAQEVSAPIVVGWFHACALTSGGVRCWRYNKTGTLGDGTIADRTAPVDVSGLSSGVVALAAVGTGFHACARMSGGGIECWGLNDRGQLGDRTTTSRLTPVDVEGFGDSE
jgi:hypothetical protein